MEFSQGGWVRVWPGGDGAEILAVAGAAVLALLAVAGAGLRRGSTAGSRRRPFRPRWRSAAAGAGAVRLRPRPAVDGARDRVAIAADQLRAVEASDFERCPLLNRTEARLLPALERLARAAGPGHRVMAQVALNELIRPARGAPEAALGAIVAKRLDFAIVDADGMLACAVEMQGAGHYQDHAAARDAVKREALRKAGVRLVEVHPDWTEAWLGPVVEAAMAAVASPLPGRRPPAEPGAARRG